MLKNIFPLALLALTVIGCAPTAQNQTESMTTPVRNVGTDPAGTAAERQAVQDVLTTLFSATDDHEWNRVSNVFADSVQLDYSDLGAEAATLAPKQIVSNWKGLLPGFERTVHNPHNFAVWVAGDRASATFDAIALHYLDGQHWTVFAGYDAELKRDGNDWKIDRMRLSLYDQEGNENLPGMAMRNVKNGKRFPSAGSATAATRAADQSLATLETANVNNYVNFFASDARQVMPLAPENFPSTVSGRTGLRKQYAPVGNFVSQRYEREIYPTSNPNVAIAKYNGTIEVSPGEFYNNSYVSLYETNDAGKITTFTEYFNPTILQNGFPGLEPAHYSIHPAAASPADGVDMQEVSFTSEGDRLVGHLFLPPNFNANTQYPAVVVTGSWTSTKEQMPDEYASLLAKDGFVALTFDFRGFGESEGSPRQYEDHARKIQDIKNAVTYLLDRPYTSTDITGLGVCASSGYMAHATAQDSRIRRLAMIAPWLHNPTMTAELYASRPGGKEGLLKLSREAQRAYETTGEVRYDQATSEINPLAAMYVPGGAFPYYLDPAMGAGKYYPNLWAVMSWEPWLNFDAISAAEDIDVPVFIVHSENGAVPQGAKDFIDGLPGDPKVKWLNDYNQIELYYKPAAVSDAMGQMSEWLTEAAM